MATPAADGPGQNRLIAVYSTAWNTQRVCFCGRVCVCVQVMSFQTAQVAADGNQQLGRRFSYRSGASAKSEAEGAAAADEWGKVPPT